MHRPQRGGGALSRATSVWISGGLGWVRIRAGGGTRQQSLLSECSFLGCPWWAEERITASVDNRTRTGLQEKHALAS